jgi:hypothetical protein
MVDDDTPLVATREFGGPYDSASYIAGWEMGELQAMLAEGHQIYALSIRAENLRQADILAMSYGYLMAAHEMRGGLVNVEIYKAAPDPEF